MRARKRAVVAMARRLAVDLWRIQTGQCSAENKNATATAIQRDIEARLHGRQHVSEKLRYKLTGEDSALSLSYEFDQAAFDALARDRCQRSRGFDQLARLKLTHPRTSEAGDYLVLERGPLWVESGKATEPGNRPVWRFSFMR